MTEGRIAVLIDYENTGLRHISLLLDQLSSVGRVFVRRAYADWSGIPKQHKDDLLALAVEPVQLFRTTTTGKNTSDLRMTVDAMDLLYMNVVDTFAIVSSDSDFLPLVSRLHASGKTVIGAGSRATAVSALVKSCDRFFYFEDLEKLEAQARPNKSEEESIIVKAHRLAANEDGEVTGAKLHDTMQKLDPGFDFKSHGFRTFTKYLESQPGISVRKSKGPGDTVVTLREK
jgi:uncharacterized protein (TIGR00288 family)